MLTYELQNPLETALKFEIESGEFEGKALIGNKLQPCMDLSCSCGSIYFRDENDQEYAFSVEEKCLITWKENEEILSEKDSFLKALENEITDEQWSDLRSFFRELKGVASEVFDTKQIHVEFENYEEILRDSLLVAYQAAMPWAIDLTFEVENIKYLMTDFYCVVPNCDCKDVSMLVSKFDDPENSFEILYNYKNNTASLGETENKDLPTKLILAEFRKSQVQTLQDLLKNRHDRLRAFFKDFLRRKNIRHNFNAPFITPNVIGRNDLCSCGSGKKYKKCCGK